MNYKKIAFFSAYNIIVVLFMIIIFELIIRFFVPEIQPQGTSEKILKENRYFTSIGLNPNSNGFSNGANVSVNKFGFRNNNIPIDTSKESWLFLGDSVTMGIGVEDDSTFSAIIQRKFSNINILNPSAIGWSVNDYKNAAKYFITKNENNLKISKIFIFYCLNDLYNSEISKEAPGEYLRENFGSLLRYIRLNSRLYIFLKNLFSDRSKAYFEYDKQFYNPNNPEFENAIKTIISIDSLCARKKIQFIFVSLPYEYQLRGKGNSKQPQQLIIGRLLSENILTYNMFNFFSEKALQKAVGSKSLFLYYDGIHFSNLGHRFAADFILKYIIKQ
ncbi:MAG: SGNH/GDSL hydrolase family protein [Ignavibacteriaceae bacterium]